MAKIMKTLEQERSELNTLIDRGVSFEVQDIEVSKKSYLWGIINKKELVPVTRKFVIGELTLGTLDRLSAEWINMAIDEEEIKKEDSLTQARIMANKHAIRCARVIALAVLNSDILIPKVGKGGVVRYEEDTARLEELTDLFARQMKPSDLYQLYILINTMSNLGDFLNSIRLMSINRTTVPNRIEENSEG